jgi:hypothetical protein
MIVTLRKFGPVMLVLIPLLFGVSILHTFDLGIIAPSPVEQSQTDNLPNSLSETLEEISKEDDLHSRYNSLFLDNCQLSSKSSNNDLRAKIVLLVPTPPPDKA